MLTDDKKRELERLGILTPAILARMEQLREEQVASGLTPEEFKASWLKRLEAAHEDVHETKTGWMLPVTAGFVGALTLAVVVMSVVNHERSWAALISLFVTSGGMFSQFDRDDLPPRRRIILGILLGAALAAIPALAFVVL